MININLVRVSGGSGPFIRLILENTMVSLVTLELDLCNAESQNFGDVVPIVIRDLRISRCHSNMRFFWDLSLLKIRRCTVQVCLSGSDLAGTDRDARRSGLGLYAYRHNITETNRLPY